MYSRFKPNDAAVFVQMPEEFRERVLHPARHVGTQGDCPALELETPLELTPGQDLFLYYELRRKFMQQPARVTEVAAQGASIVVELTADAILAESREYYRCSTLVEEITARLGEETDCEVLDVSQAGFAVHGRAEHPVAGRIEASLTFEGKAIEGAVVIQSAQPRPDGRIRYGVRVTDGMLERAISRIAMSVQRRQLRRRSGN